MRHTMILNCRDGRCVMPVFGSEPSRDGGEYTANLLFVFGGGKFRKIPAWLDLVEKPSRRLVPNDI